MIINSTVQLSVTVSVSVQICNAHTKAAHHKLMVKSPSPGQFITMQAFNMIIFKETIHYVILFVDSSTMLDTTMLAINDILMLHKKVHI